MSSIKGPIKRIGGAERVRSRPNHLSESVFNAVCELQTGMDQADVASERRKPSDWPQPDLCYDCFKLHFGLRLQQ